jgi:hypothetical protein
MSLKFPLFGSKLENIEELVIFLFVCPYLLIFGGELAEKSCLNVATGVMAASRLYTELNSGVAVRTKVRPLKLKGGNKNMSSLTKFN